MSPFISDIYTHIFQEKNGKSAQKNVGKQQFFLSKLIIEFYEIFEGEAHGFVANTSCTWFSSFRMMHKRVVMKLIKKFF